jgi:YjbE family integral membrane protein
MIELLNGIGVNTQPQFWISVLQIVWINVLLSGDNAVVIALACRSLPAKQRLWGMVLGTGVALLLRLIFAGVVATLMVLPYIKIAGGLALLWIAIKLLTPTEEANDGSAASDSLWRAVKLIAIADVVMSLDNVIAVAAAANGSFALLVFGLGISIPAIVAGANIIMAMLNYFPLIIWAGAALLGWIAGDVVATDTAVSQYAASFGADVPHQLELILSVIGVVVTLGVGYIGRARQARHAATIANPET